MSQSGVWSKNVNQYDARPRPGGTEGSPEAPARAGARARVPPPGRGGRHTAHRARARAAPGTPLEIRNRAARHNLIMLRVEMENYQV